MLSEEGIRDLVENIFRGAIVSWCAWRSSGKENRWELWFNTRDRNIRLCH